MFSSLQELEGGLRASGYIADSVATTTVYLAASQEPAENEARNNDLPFPPDVTVAAPGLATRTKQIAKQQVQQNRFVIIGAGAIVIALLIFVATSMPHRSTPQKVKSYWDWVWPLAHDCVHAWNERPARQCELRSWR